MFKHQAYLLTKRWLFAPTHWHVNVIHILIPNRAHGSKSNSPQNVILILTQKVYETGQLHSEITCCVFLVGGSGKELVTAQLSATLVVYFWWVGVGKSTSYSTAFRYACCIFLVGGSGKVLVTAQLSATLVVVYFWWMGVGKCASYSTAFSYTKSYRTSLCSCHWFLGKEKRGYTKEKYQKGGYGCTIWDVGEWGWKGEK